MILNCPSCSTRYLTDPASFQPNGRMVRCANCGHSWFQKPPEDMPKSVAGSKLSGGAAPLMDPITPYSRSNMGKRRLAGSTIAMWLILAIAVFGLGTAFYQYRTEIVRGWPQTASLYQLVGVDVNATGMIFLNEEYSEENQDGMRVMVVRADVVNITDQDLLIPRVQIVLQGEGGEELYRWSVTLPESRLAANETLPFVTRLSSPPLATRTIVVEFADGAE